MTPAQQAMLLDIVREWAGIINDAFAAPRMDEIQANLRADLVRVERPDDRWQRRLLPHPGADAGHRVRAAAQRRPHPHHLPRSDQRLRIGLCGASSGGTALIGLALALALGASVSAHRRDEYLQAARIAVEPDHVGIELDLTPGTAVADALLATIDGDRDGSLSAIEQAAYARRVLGEMSLVLDGRPLPLRLASSTFPDLGEARRGEAGVRLRLRTGAADLRPGPHQLTFTNAHLPEHSAYLANALVPESGRVAVTAQRRAVDQHELTIEFTLGATAGAASRAPLVATLAFAAALIVPLSRRRRPRESPSR